MKVLDHHHLAPWYLAFSAVCTLSQPRSMNYTETASCTAQSWKISDYHLIWLLLRFVHQISAGFFWQINPCFAWCFRLCYLEDQSFAKLNGLCLLRSPLNSFHCHCMRWLTIHSSFYFSCLFCIAHSSPRCSLFF